MIKEYFYCTVEAFSKSFHNIQIYRIGENNLNAFDAIQIPDVLSLDRIIIYDCSRLSPNAHNEYVIKPGTNRNIIQIDDFNLSTARSSRSHLHIPQDNAWCALTFRLNFFLSQDIDLEFKSWSGEAK